MREAGDIETVRIPVMIREGSMNTLLAFHTGLFETERQPNTPVETTTRRFVETYLGLKAAKILNSGGRVGNIHGLAVYPGVDYPVEMFNAHRGLVKAYDPEEFITDKRKEHSFIDIYFVQQALAISRKLR